MKEIIKVGFGIGQFYPYGQSPADAVIKENDAFAFQAAYLCITSLHANECTGFSAFRTLKTIYQYFHDHRK